MASGWEPNAGRRRRLSSKTLLLLLSALLLRGPPGGGGSPIPPPRPRPRPRAPPPPAAPPPSPSPTTTGSGPGGEEVGDGGARGLPDDPEEQLLRAFNLTGAGGEGAGAGAGVRVEPPEYMMELYNRFANDHSAMPTANIIRSFKNEAPALGEAEPSDVRRHPLLFNVSVPRHERITAAELRLYTLVQNDRHLYSGVDRRVSVYELWPPDDDEGAAAAAGAGAAPPPPGPGPAPAPAELASRRVYGVDDGWEAFDLTAAVQRWRSAESGTTHRLEVHIASLPPPAEEEEVEEEEEEGGGGPGAEEPGSREAEAGRSDATPPAPAPETETGDMQIDASPEEKHRPLLIVFSDDQSGDDRQERQELSEMIDHETTSDLALQRDNLELPGRLTAGGGGLWGEEGPRRREEEDGGLLLGGEEGPDEEEDLLLQTRSNNMIYDDTASSSRFRRSNARGDYCKRRSLLVEFRDIGWDSWILAPTGYDAFECSGVCAYPLTKHVTPTKHAIVQTLVNINSPQKAARACCVPTKLEPISLLYLDDTGVVTYKYKYEGMTVAECGCR
ncbi:unnamed protein product [Boreogadus saida]